MQMIENPEERTVGRNGGTHASAVSKMLLGMGYPKFHQYDTDRGGYFCSNWGTDSQGGIMVKTEFRRPGRGLKGKPSEDTINKVRRAKLTEMAKGLREVGYYVSWGWDEASGDPDTTFIVVSTNPARVPSDEQSAEQDTTPSPATIAAAAREHLAKTQEAVEEPMEYAPEPEPVPQPPVEAEAAPEALWAFLISIPQIEQTVLEVTRAFNAGKDDAARRMEHTLYQKVLLAIVGGGPADPRHLAAAALATQHLSISR